MVAMFWLHGNTLNIIKSRIGQSQDAFLDRISSQEIILDIAKNLRKEHIPNGQINNGKMLLCEKQMIEQTRIFHGLMIS